MILKEVLKLEGKVLNCIEGRTSSFSVNKILTKEEFTENCILCVIFYTKSINIQAIFKLLDVEFNESLSYSEETSLQKIYSNLDEE